MSDSTLCEIECFHLEGMSDTPSELRVVVDRSSETISNSNNLPSTSSVFSCVVLGSMEEDAPNHEAMMPQLEKMYMVHEDYLCHGYIKKTKSSTRRSLLP